MRRRIVTRILLCVVLMAGGVNEAFRAGNADAQPVPLEYQIKVAFLYQFIKFIEWPPQAFRTPNQTICIGVVDGGPITGAIQAIEGKEARGHKIIVKRFKASEDLGFCHILFISSSMEGRMTEILERLKGTSTLTVSDIDGFARRGGMINFITVENKVQFEINVEAAAKANLQISSHLLRLARIVTEGG